MSAMTDVKPCGAATRQITGWDRARVCDLPEGHDGGHRDSRDPDTIWMYKTFRAPEDDEGKGR